MLKIVEDEASPLRCTAITAKGGQCMNEVEPGNKFCRLHGGRSLEARNYRLSKYKLRLKEMLESDEILSLREEVGLLRIMIEERMNCVQNARDLILHSSPVADLISRVEKCVVSCNKLESNLGKVLDAKQILDFASDVISIIAEEIQDQDLLSKISEKILLRVSKKEES